MKKRFTILLVLLTFVAVFTVPTLIARGSCEDAYDRQLQQINAEYAYCQATAGSSGNWYGIAGCYTTWQAAKGAAAAMYTACVASGH